MYQQHPLSAAFPAMSADDFLSLKDSITEIGVQNPITLFEGMVIDGWHRYTAANELGMACPSVELGDVDPRDFVLAQNKARRHITQAQLVACASAVLKWHPQGGNQTALSAVCSTSKDVAEKTGASLRTVEQYRAVEKKAAPEVVEAVKRGEIGLPKAAAIAQLPAEQQAAALRQPMPKKSRSAPVAVPEPEPEDFGPSAEELAAQEAQEQADRERVAAMLDADDAMAVLVSENKRLVALNAQLQLRLNGLMNEKAEAIRLVNQRDRTIAKLERQLKEVAA